MTAEEGTDVAANTEHPQASKPSLDLDAVATRLKAMGVSVEHSAGSPVLYAGEPAPWPNRAGRRERAVIVGVDVHIPHDSPQMYDLDAPKPGRMSVASQDDERDGEYLPDRVTVAAAAKRIAHWARTVDAQRHRLELAVETTVEAFWTAASQAYPEVTTGDFGPGETVEVEQALREALKLWLFYNRPDKGIATTTPPRPLRITPMARYACDLRQDHELVGGWMPDIWALRQRVGLVIAVPLRGDPDSEVYATDHDDAVNILNSWKAGDLRDACRYRQLPVPAGKRNKAGYIEALIAAGPAHFNEGGDRF